MRRIMIVAEGGDATGKDTLTRRLASDLGAEHFSLPQYQTDTGKLILQLLRRHWSCEWNWAAAPDGDGVGEVNVRNSMVLQSLFTLNRVEVQPQIEAALRRGPVVVDRWYLSSLAYGAAEGLDPDWLRSISSVLLEPDAWLYLDCPPEVAAARRPPRDLNESNLALMAAVRVEYERLLPVTGGAKADPDFYRCHSPSIGTSAWTCGRVKGGTHAARIDATLPASGVLAAAHRFLAPLLA